MQNYLIIVNEFNYPTTSGRELDESDEFDNTWNIEDRKDALKKCKELCNKFRKNFEDYSGDKSVMKPLYEENDGKKTQIGWIVQGKKNRDLYTLSRVIEIEPYHLKGNIEITF